MATDLSASDTATRLMPGVKANESGDTPDDQVPVGDGGQAGGAYQVHPGAVEDVNRAFGTNYTWADTKDTTKGKDIAQKYLTLQVQRFGPRVGLEAYNAGPTRVASGDVPQSAVDYAARALNVSGAGNSDALGADFQRISTMFPPVDSSRVQPTIDALKSSLVAQKAETEGIQRQTEADYTADRQRARTAYDAANKDDTTPWNKPPPPRDALEGFASAGSIFAAIASAFTRTPAVSAMNGMAAAINARRAGDQQAYDQAYKVWQDNTKLAIDRQKMASDRLTQALEMMKTDSAHGLALMNQALTEHGDDRVQIMAAAGMWDQVDQANQARNRAIANTAVAYQRILHPAGERPQILTDPGRKDDNGNPVQYIWNPSETGPYQFTTLGHDPYTPSGAQRMGVQSSASQYDKPALVQTTDENGQTTSKFAQQDKRTGQWVTADETRTPVENVKGAIKPGDDIKPDDPAIMTTAKMIANYQMPGLTSYVIARMPKFASAVNEEILRQNPGYRSSEFTARNAAARTFAAGPVGNQIQSINTAVAHLGTAMELASALFNGDIQTVNRLKQQFQEQFGSAAPTNFNLAKQIVGQEIVKAIVLGGGGVTERQDAQKNLDIAESPEQLQGAAATAKSLLAGQVRSAKKRYEGSVGATDFEDRFLLPETRKELQLLPPTTEGGAQPAGAAGPKATNDQGHTIVLDPARGLYKNPDTGLYWDGGQWVK